VNDARKPFPSNNATDARFVLGAAFGLSVVVTFVLILHLT
jgi:hypothetical protein